MQHTLIKRNEENQQGNYTRTSLIVLNKSWKQQPQKTVIVGLLHLISQTIKVIRRRHAGRCRKSKDEVISDVLLKTSAHRSASIGWSPNTYISSVRTQDATKIICQERWMLGTDGESQVGLYCQCDLMMMIMIYTYVYIYIYIYKEINKIIGKKGGTILK